MDVMFEERVSSRRQSKDGLGLGAAELNSTTKDGRSSTFIKGGGVSRNSHDADPTLASMLPARSLIQPELDSKLGHFAASCSMADPFMRQPALLASA
jgi:hypothetical protein